MGADDDGELKVRIVLKATWEDDGTVDGAITETRIVVSTLVEDYGEEDYAPLPPAERSRIQMIYTPASRDGARQVTAFLRSRLWRAAQWSADLRDMVGERAADVAEQFAEEPVVKAVEGALGSRWRELHDAGTHAAPKLRLLDGDFDQLVRNTELVFEPDPTGRARPARMLSDGQRSLLHLALTAAALAGRTNGVRDTPRRARCQRLGLLRVFGSSDLRRRPAVPRRTAVEVPQCLLEPFLRVGHSCRRVLAAGGVAEPVGPLLRRVAPVDPTARLLR